MRYGDGVPLPLLIAKAGSTIPAVAAQHGDFDRWFVEAFEHAGRAAHVVDLARDSCPANLDRYAGLLVTGSAASVTNVEPWMAPLSALLRDALDRDVAVLGVCFGHQMLAQALGGEVVKNAAGREIGTVAVEITADGANDPLFVGLPNPLEVQATHVDVVARLPAGARLLARNDHGIQAFAIGRARGVQFHPEITGDVARRYIEERRAVLESEGLDPRALLARVAPTPDALGVLANFANRVALG